MSLATSVNERATFVLECFIFFWEFENGLTAAYFGSCATGGVDIVRFTSGAVVAFGLCGAVAQVESQYEMAVTLTICSGNSTKHVAVTRCLGEARATRKGSPVGDLCCA